MIFYKKFFQEYDQSVKQLLIQIRPDILLGLILVKLFATAVSR